MATTPGLTKLHRVLEEKDGVMQAISGFLRAERLDTKRRPVLESLKWCSAALLMVAAPSMEALRGAIFGSRRFSHTPKLTSV